MRYILFMRVSTGMQDTDNQLFEIMNYINSIKKEGDEVIRFDEKAKSTRLKMKKRPVLMEMLETIKKDDIVVVYKLNRLARGYELALIHHMITKDTKAKIISLYEKDINDELIHAYAMVAAFERKNIRDNTKTALKNKQCKMEKVGTVWFGYQLDPNILQAQERSRTFGSPYKLIPHPEEQKAIQLMLELKEEGLSYENIAIELTNHGFMSRSGTPFNRGSVYRILQRELNHPALAESRSRPSLVGV